MWGKCKAFEFCFSKIWWKLDPIIQSYYLIVIFYKLIVVIFTEEDTYRGDGLKLANDPVYYADPSGYACDPTKEILSNATNWSIVTPRYSEYDDRIKKIPSIDSKNGYWEGEREESKFVCTNNSIRHILQERNVDGVNYRNRMPDFSPFAVGEVRINMTSNRDGSKGPYS